MNVGDIVEVIGTAVAIRPNPNSLITFQADIPGVVEDVGDYLTGFGGCVFVNFPLGQKLWINTELLRLVGKVDGL